MEKSSRVGKSLRVTMKVGEGKLLGALDAEAFGVGGDDADDLGAQLAAGDGFGEVLQRGAAAGDEDGETGCFHALFLPARREGTKGVISF